MGPKKSKVDTETSGSLIKSWEVSKHRSEEQSMSGIKENNMEVKVSLKQTDKCVLEDTEVREDGDVVYKLTKRLSQNGDAWVNFRDLIPDGKIRF